MEKSEQENLAAATYPFKSQFVEVMGRQIHYVELGQGEPILFVHGNPTSSYVWRSVMPTVAALTGRRCIALDLLGFGKSERPDKLKYSLKLHRDVIAGFIDALGLENIVLVAEDWGGPLAMHHLVGEADRYEAAILMETFLWTFTFKDDFEPKFRLPFRLMRGPLGFLMVQVFNIMIEKLIPQHCPITDDGLNYYRKSASTIASRRPILEFVRLNPLHNKPRESVEFIEEIRAALPSLKIPVVWFMPSPGAIVSSDHPPSQRKFEKFKTMIPNFAVKDFGHGHHFLSEENPKRVAELIIETLEEFSEENEGHQSISNATY